MSQRLKNTLSFDLTTGAAVTLPHGLVTSVGRPLAPDIIFIPSPNLEVTSDRLNVTLTNNGPALAGSILVEAWHTIERSFSDVNDEDLPIKPYVVVSAEPGNEPPIPARPADGPIEMVIYANASGSDEDGKGTEEAPYRTFQRAVRDVPYIQMPGYVYKLDITNLGVEVLPPGYDLPSWKSGRVNAGGSFAVTIAADHDLAFAVAKSTLNAGVVNEDPDTGMFSVNDPSKTYLVNELVGLFVYGTSSGDPNETGLAGVVHANSATEVFVTSNEGGDWTFPFTIKKCTATLQGESGGAFSGMITVGFVDSLEIKGVAIIPTDPGDTGFAQQGGHVWFVGCDLLNPRLQSGMRFHGLEACNLVAPNFAGETYLKSSRVTGEASYNRTANQGLAIFRGTTLDGCPTILCFETSSVDSGIFGGILNISNVLIKNSIGDAINWPGGNASLKNTKIENAVAGPFSPGNALVFRGGVRAVLQHVTGTGNAGIGVVVNDGAQVEILDGTTLTGAGGDQEVGVLGAAAYPANPFNVADPATFSRLFDNTP